MPSAHAADSNYNYGWISLFVDLCGLFKIYVVCLWFVSKCCWFWIFVRFVCNCCFVVMCKDSLIVIVFSFLLTVIIKNCVLAHVDFDVWPDIYASIAISCSGYVACWCCHYYFWHCYFHFHYCCFCYCYCYYYCYLHCYFFMFLLLLLTILLLSYGFIKKFKYVDAHTGSHELNEILMRHYPLLQLWIY